MAIIFPLLPYPPPFAVAAATDSSPAPIPPGRYGNPSSWKPSSTPKLRPHPFFFQMFLGRVLGAWASAAGVSFTELTCTHSFKHSSDNLLSIHTEYEVLQQENGQNNSMTRSHTSGTPSPRTPSRFSTPLWLKAKQLHALKHTGQVPTWAFSYSQVPFIQPSLDSRAKDWRTGC